jgi:hypothetical protein
MILLKVCEISVGTWSCKKTVKIFLWNVTSDGRACYLLSQSGDKNEGNCTKTLEKSEERKQVNVC